ncbi:MAG: hypothetical protein ACO1PW_03720, partial [Actinomycetota bacterium]
MRTLREGVGPGLHRITAADPSARADEVADELGGRVCRTPAEVDSAVADARARAQPDAATIAYLERLARRWASVSRTADRTRQRVVSAAGQRLAPGGLAVHPETVRDRAPRLEAARAGLQGAGDAVAAPEATAPYEEAVGAPPAGPPLDPPSGGRTETSAAQLRTRRNQALGLVLASFGLGLILLALGVLPLWAALSIPFVASLWALRHLRPAGSSPSEKGPSLLSQVGAYTDERFGSRRAAEQHEAERARLDAARSRAEEEVRVAVKAWSDLAGPDVGPEDVEAVVRRFDPGLGSAEHLVGEAVGVRATEVAVARLVERWDAAWASLGVPAPSIADGELAIQALAQRTAPAIVLVGEVTDRGEAIA